MSHRDITMTIKFTPSDLDSKASIMTIDITPKPCDGEGFNEQEEFLTNALQDTVEYLQFILE